MKRILVSAALAVAAAPALAADVGVSISIGQPGFYGRIDIGRRAKLGEADAGEVLANRRDEAFIVHHAGHRHLYNLWRQETGEGRRADRPVYSSSNSTSSRTSARIALCGTTR